VNDNTVRAIEPEQPGTPEAPQPHAAVITRGTRRAAILMALVVLVLGAFDYLASAGRLGDAGDLVLAALTLVPLAMAALILPVARTFGEGGTIRTQWLLFGFGMLSAGVGNTIFITLYLVTGKDPYPSIADVFTLAMYAILAVAFYLSIRAYRGILDLRPPLVIAGTVSASVMALVYFTVIGPYVVFAPAETQPFVTRVFNTVYPIMDVFLLLMPAIALGLLVSKLGTGRVAWPLWLVTAGAVTLAVTDTIFAYAGYVGAGRTPIIDAGYAIAPMLVGLAVLVARDVYRS